MASSYTVNNIIEQDNLNSGINSYIKILTPIQFTLETCCQSDDNAYLNFLMTSPRENNRLHRLRGGPAHRCRRIRSDPDAPRTTRTVCR